MSSAPRRAQSSRTACVACRGCSTPQASRRARDATSDVLEAYSLADAAAETSGERLAAVIALA